MKRTLHFGNPAYLKIKKHQMIVSYRESAIEKSVSIEDVGIVILEHPQITISHQLISALLENNAVLVTCDGFHMPQGLMLNLNGHSTQQRSMYEQSQASDYLKDRLWKQTIKAKITNQANLLKQNGITVENMTRWATKVRNGDPDNLEARAAVFYWQKLFVDHVTTFKRGRFEGEPNNLLNYGYAILRATVARSLVGTGLHPSFGYHHRNKYNAYCLADDLMEPYRPFVDEVVLELMRTHDHYFELTKELKVELLKVPVLDVTINEQKSPLLLATQQSAASLQKCYAKEVKVLKLPTL